MRWGLLRRDGLSPLARGTLQITIGSDVHYRFIPAGAGNTLRVTDLPGKPTVYPRWRGEHVSIPNIKPLQFGLSPLARGTLTVEHCRVIEMRFIPAGAGNTNLDPESLPGAAVYPRWRGEHTKKIDFNINSF